MEKFQLPVIVLKDIVLLPFNELKLEIDSTFGHQLEKALKLIDENRVFIVTKKSPLEETIQLPDLPEIGTVAEIQSHLELPNGKMRIILEGKRRAKSFSYSYTFSNIIQSDITLVDESIVAYELAIATTRKLKKEWNSFVKLIPSISNSVIARLEKCKTIEEMTDIVVGTLSLPLSRKKEYLNCLDSLKRTEMILADIYQEEALYEIEKRIDNKVQNSLENSQKDYILREKIKLIQGELGDISPREKEISDLKDSLEKLECKNNIREKISLVISQYESMPTSSPEISMTRNYLDYLLHLPWNRKTIDQDNLQEVKKSLDLSHYGLESVKERIIEYLAVKKYSDNLSGPILCFVGPPGTGKTTLAQSIARSIHRRFVKISVGGVDDEAEIIGHRKSYLGASPGRIIEGMRKAKSANPVFLIDEIDKMSKGIKGDPASALLEVFDVEQNKSFRDNYLEIEYDLSQVMFILTANSIDDIPRPLLDRLEIIDIYGYTEYEKKDIAKKYLIPKLCKSHGLQYLKVYDNVIIDIIRYYTKEAGVRELERQLSKIIRKIVTSFVLDRKEEKKVLTPACLEEYLGHHKFENSTCYDGQVGVVSALAYTSYGGEVLPIEVNYYKGKGKLILTGSLGDVMKESATLALSYIKANYETFGIDYSMLCENDIHIHIPSGAVAKDGPSAGVTLVTSLISAFTNRKMDYQIAMTGEITLRGNILPVGGLREKCLGAIRNNIHKIFIPQGNLGEIEELPQDVRSRLEFVPVSNYMEIFEAIYRK